MCKYYFKSLVNFLSGRDDDNWRRLNVVYQLWRLDLRAKAKPGPNRSLCSFQDTGIGGELNIVDDLMERHKELKDLFFHDDGNRNSSSSVNSTQQVLDFGGIIF